MQMGKLKLFREGKLNFEIRLLSKEKVQLRDNSLEACRQFINGQLEKNMKDQFYFEVKPFPHHILRENKMLTGAGSDRMQTGMQLSFGKTVGRAALIKPNQEIFFIATNNRKNSQFVQHILQKIKSKLPCKSRIVSEKKED